jgi:hypothetical protein
MKLFVVVNELKYDPGVYGFKALEEGAMEKSTDDKITTASQTISTLLGVGSGGVAVATALRVGSTVLGSMTPFTLGISGALIAAQLAKGTYDIFAKNPSAKKGEWGLQQSFKRLESDNSFLGYLRDSIVVHTKSLNSNYKDSWSKPELFGALKSAKQLQKVLEADGGNSEIIVVPKEIAKKYFRHSGDGVIAAGKYMPHPKKINALIPFDSYHHHLLKELEEEFISVLAGLGAKKIYIETLEGVTIDGCATVSGRGKAGSKYAASELGKKTYEFFPEECDVENVLNGRVWIQDFPQMMTFVETRKTFRLAKFKESLKVDTSFSTDLEVVCTLNSNLKWEKVSNYLFEVDFFSRNELKSSIGASASDSTQ